MFHCMQGGAHADVAFLPLGTLAHALDNAAATATLRACRQALRPGGLLVLEVAHSWHASCMQDTALRAALHPCGFMRLQLVPGACTPQLCSMPFTELHVHMPEAGPHWQLLHHEDMLKACRLLGPHVVSQPRRTLLR